MRRCLQLASLGAGFVAPNPMVGAVLVFDNRVIGEGYHMKYGEAHAEVNCLASVKKEDSGYISQSTLYVSLEPCSHFGKTPPCADLIIENKIPEVVVGCYDPFEKVNGGGIEKLRDAGIHVVTGILEREAEEMNKRFFTFHTKARPYLILKWAQSADAKIAASDYGAVKISNDLSDIIVHKWRSQEASIMVGFNTAKFDDPALTNRHWAGRNPIRIVVDPMLELKGSLQLFAQDVPTIVINSVKDADDEIIGYRKLNGKLPLVEGILKILHKEQILSVIVEGGAKMLQAVYDSGFWDEIRIVQNTKLQIGNGISAPIIHEATPVIINTLGNDTHIFYRNSSNGK